MAHIEPFRALRPRPELAVSVAAPPYDVLSSEEARELAGNNPHSFLHIGKPEIDLPPGADIHSEEVYAKGKENFERFIREKIIIQDPRKNFYIYRQVWGNHIQTGLVAAASCQDYLDDVIKKHELTRPDKENDRMHHIEALEAQTGPVFLTYRCKAAIAALIEEGLNKIPEYDFSTADGVRHIFFVVDDDSLIARLKAEFSGLDGLYVADGHHRSAAAARIKVKRQEVNPKHTGREEYNFFLSVIFPDSQMKILPYNRVVKDLNGLTDRQFLQRISGKFNVRKGTRKIPGGPRQFCMFLADEWYLIEAGPGSFDPSDPIESLDVAILQTNLFAPILDITDPRTDKRIDFVGGIRGTDELEKRVRVGGFKAAFSLYPTTIDQLFTVADRGKIMPPKSTWFEPKLKDGLAVHMIDG